ncbi:MAG: hypothetical protein ACK2TV_07460, partial [Anaerolineales bacterium]
MRKLLFAILTITSLFLNSYNRYPTQSPPEPETPLPSEARIKTALSDSQNWNPDPIVEEVLQIFPLWQGSSWTYHYLGYDRSMEVVWQVVETVIDTYSQGGYYITKIERTVDLIEGQPPHDFLVRPKPGTFWYLIDGHN